jgi:hypothetical protein
MTPVAADVGVTWDDGGVAIRRENAGCLSN